MGKKKTENKKSIISEFTEGLEISDFLQLLRRLIIHLVDSSSGHVRVRIKKLEIIVADKEPDAAALIFGGVNTVVSGILEYLELKTRLFPLHKSRIYVKCDFEKEHTEAEIELWTKIRIIHLVKFALKFFFDFMRIKESKNNTFFIFSFFFALLFRRFFSFMLSFLGIRFGKVKIKKQSSNF